MSDEAAFLRALRERPDDETARLVYTDWLDDRSDPRAEYLRAEAAWVALQPSDEQYRPLYRRVSRLAAGLELEWFATVSRIWRFVRQAWTSVEQYWESDPDAEPSESVREWPAARRGFESAFDRFVGSEATARRFCIPVDYLAFSWAIGGGWRRGEEGDELYSALRASERTLGGGLAHGAEANERQEIWILIAVSGVAHDFYLCCDLDCPRFGKVALGENYHPWMKSGSAPLRACGDSFLQFLGRFLPVD